MSDDPAPTQPSFWHAYRLPIIFGSFSLFFLSIAFLLFLKTVQTTEPIRFHDLASEASQSAGSGYTVTVDVGGAVNHPGVYVLEEGKRIQDAIDAAGGLSLEADSEKITTSINRAARLLDGAKITIPKKGSVQTAESVPGALGIPINTAAASELDTLSGVGEVTAQKIIDGRPYQTLEELVSRKIISQSLFEKIKTQLRL